MKTHMSGVNQSDEIVKSEQEANKISDFSFDRRAWQALGFEEYWLEDEVSMVRKSKIPSDTKHGRYRFSDWYEKTRTWDQVDIPHPLSTKGIDPSKLFFFDIETTGLSSGAGTQVFMIGYVRMFDSYVEVTQHVLPDPSCETAFFHAFLNEFSEDDYLVTFNGKAFDWPQVKTRHTFVRKRVPSLPTFGHFDLLHGTRRFFKHRLPSCRLAIIEDQVLHVDRGHDTPGDMAPLLYFEYLKSGDPSPLQAIVDHHRSDVLSLIALHADLSSRVLESEQADDLLISAQWYSALKDDDMAFARFQRAYELTGKGEAAFYSGMLCKKLTSPDEAVHWFEKAITSSHVKKTDALVELAKYYEHERKAYDCALRFVREAVQEEKWRERVSTNSNGKVLTELQKRLQRLEKKQNHYKTNRPTHM